MKNIFGLAVLISLTSILGVGCLKYEDGPWLSFRGKKNRVANSWVYHMVQRNGLNITDGNGYGSVNYSSSRLGFNEEDRFSIETFYIDSLGTNPTTLDGDWELVDKKRVLKLIFDDTSIPDRELRITRLFHDELWFEEEFPGDILLEFHMVGEE